MSNLWPVASQANNVESFDGFAETTNGNYCLFLVRCFHIYIGSIAYDVEAWVLGKVDQKYLGSLIMWSSSSGLDTRRE